MVTTSRDPSSRLIQFAKEMKLLFPGSTRVNRGAMVVTDLVESCRNHAFTDIVLLHENRCGSDSPSRFITEVMLHSTRLEILAIFVYR